MKKKETHRLLSKPVIKLNRKKGTRTIDIHPDPIYNESIRELIRAKKEKIMVTKKATTKKPVAKKAVSKPKPQAKAKLKAKQRPKSK